MQFYFVGIYDPTDYKVALTLQYLFLNVPGYVAIHPLMSLMPVLKVCARFIISETGNFWMQL